MQTRVVVRKVGVTICTLAIATLFATVTRADQFDSHPSAALVFGPTEKGLALSVSLTHQTLSPGDPIEVTFVIKNNGPPISIFRYGYIQEYGLTGVGPDGTTIRRLGPSPPFNGSVRSGWHLNTGEAYEHTTSDIRWAYDFRAPGKYTFAFTSVVTLRLGGQSYATLTSNTVKLTLQPRKFLRAIPADSIPNSLIDAHIPPNTDPADRKIVREVMAALPPAKRQYIVWLHVPPLKYGYQELPNHGLVIMEYDNPDVHISDADNLPGLYVLYFDGKVQLDANVIYDSILDSYLQVVPRGI